MAWWRVINAITHTRLRRKWCQDVSCRATPTPLTLPLALPLAPLLSQGIVSPPPTHRHPHHSICLGVLPSASPTQTASLSPVHPPSTSAFLARYLLNVHIGIAGLLYLGSGRPVRVQENTKEVQIYDRHNILQILFIIFRPAFLQTGGSWCIFYRLPHDTRAAVSNY